MGSDLWQNMSYPTSYKRALFEVGIESQQLLGTVLDPLGTGERTWASG